MANGICSCQAERGVTRLGEFKKTGKFIGASLAVKQTCLDPIFMFIKSVIRPNRSAGQIGYPKFVALAHYDACISLLYLVQGCLQSKHTGGLKNVVVRSLPELNIRSDDMGKDPTIKCGAPKTVQVASQAPDPMLNMTIFCFVSNITHKSSGGASYMMEPHHSVGVCISSIHIL